MIYRPSEPILLEIFIGKCRYRTFLVFQIKISLCFRLVKFESTKSLASTSSRSLGGAISENGDREATLQNVLTYIAEQQKYVTTCEGKESRPPSSISENTKEFNIEGPPLQTDDIKICDSDISDNMTLSLTKKSVGSDNENYVTLKQLCDEFTLNEQNLSKEMDSVNQKYLKQTIAYAEEICLVTPLDVESESCSNMAEQPVDICSSVNVELNSATDYNRCSTLEGNISCDLTTSFSSDLIKSSDTTVESLTSSISTPDTIVSRIPRRKYTPSKIAPVSPVKQTTQNAITSEPSRLPKSKILHKNSKISRPLQREKIVCVQQQLCQPQHVITSEKLPQNASAFVSTIIEGPPHRAVSFHERATSKDVIDELNRMIKNGDENLTSHDGSEGNNGAKLDEACRSTGWIHVERDIDLTDPKVNIFESARITFKRKGHADSISGES